MSAGRVLIILLLSTAAALVLVPALSRRPPPLAIRDVPSREATAAPQPAPPPGQPQTPAPPPAAPEERLPSLSLPKSTFSPGERIRVRFTAPRYPDDAWIGLIPSEIPHGDEAVNDRHDVAYQHLNGRTEGEVVFVAPPTGQWDVRLHSTDSGGAETASVSLVACEGKECGRFPFGPSPVPVPAPEAGPAPGGGLRTADGPSYAGLWRASDGRDCRLQQDGREAWWLCLPRRGEARWTIGHGPITANAITLRVTEVPVDARSLASGDGQASGTAQRGETLVLTAVGTDELRAVRGDGPGGQETWKRVRLRSR